MNAGAGSGVPAAAVRRIVSLAHEAGEIEGRQARLGHVLAGMSAVIGADVGAMFVFGSPSASVPRAGLIHGYTATQTQAVLAEYATQGVDFDLMAATLRREFHNAGPVIARRRQELIPSRSWYNSPFVNDARRRWGVDHCVYSLQQLGPVILGMGLNREFGGAPFRAEDRSLIEIFHLAIARMARDCTRDKPGSLDDARRARLAPRARDVLDLLLRGMSNSEIADQLRIRPNTVHHYCKTVFGAFGVGSRSELVARWFDRREPRPTAVEGRPS